MKDIIDCTCEHAYQDRLFGEGKRVASPLKETSAGGATLYRCSVCGNLKYAGKHRRGSSR